MFIIGHDQQIRQAARQAQIIEESSEEESEEEDEVKLLGEVEKVLDVRQTADGKEDYLIKCKGRQCIQQPMSC